MSTLAPYEPLISGPTLRTMSPYATQEDAELFATLAQREKDTVNLRIAALGPYLRSKRGQRGEKLQDAAAQMGVTFKQAENLAAAYRAHGWRGLVNKSQAGSAWWRRRAAAAPIAANKPFLAFWNSLVVANKRATEPAHRELIRRWRAWRAGDASKAIPGYPTCPAVGRTGDHPTGWSYENLLRHVVIDQVMTVARIGSGLAMRTMLPSIPGTREGLRALEFIQFDDLFWNRKVMVPGIAAPMRLLQLSAIDVASSVCLVHGLKPEVPTPDGGKERIKERDTWFLICLMLARYGFPLDWPMHLIVERGTATVRAADAQMLYEVSGGQIRVCWTNMQGGLVLAWEDSATGGSNAKGLIESWHNALHYEAGALRGQIGQDAGHAPEALADMERQARQLAVATARMTPELAREMRYPFASLAEATEDANRIVHQLNTREDHEIEGFEQRLQWRVRGAGMDWLKTAPPQEMPEALLEWRSRVEMPSERLERLSAGARFARLPGHVLEQLLSEVRDIRPVRRMSVETKKIDGRTLTFCPPEGGEIPRDGEEVLVAVNPHDLSQAYVSTKTGRWLGVWPRLLGGRGRDASEAIATQRRLWSRVEQQTKLAMGREIDAAQREEIANRALAARAGLVAVNEVGAPEGMPGALMREAKAPAGANQRASVRDAAPGFAGRLQAAGSRTLSSTERTRVASAQDFANPETQETPAVCTGQGFAAAFSESDNPTPHVANARDFVGEDGHIQY